MLETSIIILSLYFIIGAAAGLLAGLLGVGGGVIVVPALLYLFKWQQFPSDYLMHMAVGTSLATIIFTTASATLTHHKQNAVLWQQVKSLAPGILVGSVTGGVLADQIASDSLSISFGILTIVIALRTLFNINIQSEHRLPPKPGIIFTGFLTGAISTIMGIGGGVILGTFFIWCNVNVRNAVATAAACSIPIALTGTVTMIMTGWDTLGLPEEALGYVYWPAAVLIVAASVIFASFGAKLSHILPVIILRRVFAVFLTAVGVSMLI